MNNGFAHALGQQNQAYTQKEGLTNASSGNKNLDLFFVIGNRNKDFRNAFDEAYAEDQKLALRVLMWARDIRGGAGERQTVRIILQHLEQNHPEHLEALIKAWPEYGRWDDLLIFQTDRAKQLAFEVIKKGLNEQNGLCAKWMPRKGKEAVELRTFLGMTPKKYRKTLVNLTKVVESQMCAKDWDGINFSHVPSVASARYQKAFGRNATVRYCDYLNALKKGALDPYTQEKAKINASAVYPYDVIKSLKHGLKDVAIQQWEALPNYLNENSAILPIVDVSGSMNSSYDRSILLPMDVAVSTGLYIADKQKGPFHGICMTFSGDSEIFRLEGKDIAEKVQNLRCAHWALNTAYVKAFENLLKFAKDNDIGPADMPKIILTISDMEFDRCTDLGGKSITALDYIKGQYEAAGYKMPNMVFWNVNSRVGNNPVTLDRTGAALVSGYSPSILKSILSGKLEEFSPMNVMIQTVGNDRYDIWK
jgi:hypothetical protein